MLSRQDRALIHDVLVTDGLRFGAPGGVIRTRVLTFYVGKQGPFTYVLDLVNYSAENIEAAYEREVNTLRGAGVTLADQ
jgi:hypothetical protein